MAYTCVDGSWEDYASPAGTACLVDGVRSTCDGDGTCQVPMSTGWIRPNYYVLSVLYAPPGSRSLVTYGENQTFGTTTSTTGTWKDDSSATLSSSFSILGFLKESFSVTSSLNQT